MMAEFMLGCNYWASHAGLFMWRDWQPQVVERDFEALARQGADTLRVFPLWSDFQPITAIYGAQGEITEMRFGEEPLPATGAGAAGVDEVMMERFATLLDLAQKHGLRLIVGLLTGWMSGRLFAPPALEGRALLTDPLALRWEVRFAACFTAAFRHHPAILAWDLGNECNVMEKLEDAGQAWLWTHTVASAIRAADPARPVISGMHSLGTRGAWRISHQGELCDLLTTHPYPLFTPHCNNDPIDTMRPALHPVAESLYYSGLGHKPCLVEECGALTGSVTGDAAAAAFLRGALFLCWAHGLPGFLWWCAFDQGHIAKAPYDTNLLECHLGLMDAQRRPKPTMEVLEDFAGFLRDFPLPMLPPHRQDGLCVLGAQHDAWAAAYGCFTLAARAGLTLGFCSAQDPLPPSPLYLVPSLEGSGCLTTRQLRALMERVAEGAVLYFSLGDTCLEEFGRYFGLELNSRYRQPKPLDVTFEMGERLTLPLWQEVCYQVKEAGCQVLGREQEGRAVYVCHHYGKGRVYLLTLPLEVWLARQSEPFSAPGGNRLHHIYRPLASSVGRAALAASPDIVLTEHPLEDGGRLCVAVNTAPAPAERPVLPAPGWRVETALRGNVFRLAGNDAAVYRCVRVVDAE